MAKLVGALSRLQTQRGYGAIDSIISLYTFIGALLGVYVAFIAPGAIPLTLSGLIRDLITVLIYMLLWPFFLFGNLHYRIS